MPIDIEKILREIHIMIAKSERVEGDLDKVIISKRELFDLLEQLNIALADMADRYEASEQAKVRARHESMTESQEIIDTASKQAEDVYAASILYTDGALNEVYAEIVEARADLRREYTKFEDKIAERLEVLRSNQDELMEQLRALSQGKKYFDLIEDYNKKIADAEAVKKAEEAEKKALAEAPVIPEKFRKKSRRKDELPAIGASLEPKEPEEDVHRNLLPADEEYIWPDDTPDFAPVEIKISSNWGTSENNVFENTTLRTKKDRKREEKYGKKAKKKKSKYDFGDEEIQLTVDPDADPDAPPSFTKEDLDAEYLRWQESKDAAKGNTAGGNSEADLTLIDLDDSEQDDKAYDDSEETGGTAAADAMESIFNKAAEVFGLKKKN